MVPRTWWLAAIWPVPAGILGPMLGVLVSRMQINHKFCIVYFEPGAFSQIFLSTYEALPVSIFGGRNVGLRMGLDLDKKK